MKKVNKALYIILLFLLSLFLTSCNGNKQDVTGLLELSLTQANLKVDESIEITARYDGEVVNVFAEWESDNPKVAVVDYGTVTALQEGMTTITVFYKGESASCAVTVEPDYRPILEVPVLSWDEETNDITWEPVKNASKYIVNLNGKDLPPTEDCRYPGKKAAGTYSVKVKALSEGGFAPSSYSESVEYRVEAPASEILQKVLVLSDIHVTKTIYGSEIFGEENLERAMKYASKEKLDLVLMVGDMVSFDDQELYNEFRNIVNYNLDYRVDVLQVMGNHEWYTSSKINQPDETDNPAVAIARFVQNNVNAPVLESDPKNINFYTEYGGVPYIMLSGINVEGMIDAELEALVKNWLDRAAKLTEESGLPIIVGYHYPIMAWDGGEISFEAGRRNNLATKKLDYLLKDYPNVIVFTGDTHFPSINEKAINQKNYTAVNVGPATYSRHPKGYRGMFDFENVKTNNQVLGAVSEGYEHVSFGILLEILTDRTVINVIDLKTEETFFAWTIPSFIDKDLFTYTDDRTNLEVGSEDFTWSERHLEVNYFQDENELEVDVYFTDADQFRNALGYMVEVIGKDGTKKQKHYLSHYYKNPQTRNDYYFSANFKKHELPLADFELTEVRVYALDFLGKPSKDYLSCTDFGESFLTDPFDLAFPESWRDIGLLAYPVKDMRSENSNSSILFSFKGINKYPYGAQMGNLKDYWNYLMVKEEDWKDAVLSFDIYNASDFALAFGLYCNGYDWGSAGTELKYAEPGVWTTISFSLKDLYKVTSQPEAIVLKVRYEGNTSSLYNYSFYMDNLQITPR